MDKILKELLQAMTLASAIGVSVLSCDTKNVWLGILAGVLVAVYVHVSNIESED